MVTFKKYTLLLILSTISFGSSFGQIVVDNNTQQEAIQPTNATENVDGGSALSTSPWDNGAATSTGSNSIISNTSTDNQRGNNNEPAENLNGTTGNGNAPGAPREGLRTNGNRTLQGRGPGGNPDVPFDDNMNMVFLIVGLVFGFFVIRKKWKLQPATIK
jgi:hypothetical protein